MGHKTLPAAGLRARGPAREDTAREPHPTGFDNPDHRRAEAKRRLEQHNPWAPATLLPPEAFSDELATPHDFERLCEPGAGTGRHSAAVQRRIMSSCAGWRERPTTDEFYEAVRATRPTRRQRGIVDMWGREATFHELIEAWAQQAYTDRQLVRALHLAGFDCGDRIREINQWATKY